LTQVDKVYINYKSDHQQPLERAKLDYLKSSMTRGTSLLGLWVPRFWLPSSTLENVDGQVAIGSLEEAEAVVRGVAGTIVYR